MTSSDHSDHRETAAVIGSGVSGLTASYLLQRRYDVTLLEADDRLGGHADTHDVLTPDGRWLPIDSGFIVHNRATYPTLIRLFDELAVRTTETEMSLSVSCGRCGLQYAGGRGLAGVFAQPRRAADPRFWRLLTDVARFHRDARALLGSPEADVDTVTLGGFVAIRRYSRYFVNHFLLPLVATVWSSGTSVAGAYPARYLFEFLNNHGMLTVHGSPVWRTVTGGSREYVQRAAKCLSAVHTSTPVRSVERHADGVEVRDEADRIFRVDRVVIATHPDQALAILKDPTPTELAVLGALPYSRNSVALHTDSRLLPTARQARASWNYTTMACTVRTPEVTGVSYYMNRLHGLDEPVDYIVSMNSDDRIDPRRVIARRTYHHPAYTSDSVAARRRLPALSAGRVAFAGAYHGWGFHEDGAASGAAAAAALGGPW
jgi:predicted NAD/FAD-binding protein